MESALLYAKTVDDDNEIDNNDDDDYFESDELLTSATDNDESKKPSNQGKWKFIENIFGGFKTKLNMKLLFHDF